MQDKVLDIVSNFMMVSYLSNSTMNTDLSISLGQILHTLIQATYHDISQLSELLQSRTDMERKIQLARFSRKTNHHFVRLLALANWASSPETSDDLSSFTTLLDTQSRLYVETADLLYLQENQGLKGSELPQFCIVSAIDILRSCTYSFLPTSISRCLISLSTISQSEKFSTLHKLDQNLRLRLINLVPTLPYTLTPSLKLYPKGCLTMRVANEFTARMTLLSDDPLIPWRLIQLDFLIRDKRSFDNRPLIHSQQKLFIQLLVQSRLFKQDEENVLSEAYQLLHSFCISMQLQVLYTQLIQLTKHWGKHNLEVEEYIPGDRLRLAYWYSSPMNLILDMHCSITVSAIPSISTLVYFHCDTPNNHCSKQEVCYSTTNYPALPHNGKSLSSDQIFIDRLIHLCIENKSYFTLEGIRKTLWDRAWPFLIRLRRSPPCLILNLGFPDIPNSLVISKDPRNGRLQCVIFDYNISSNSLIKEKCFCKTLYSVVQRHLDELARGIFDHINYSFEYLTLFRAQFRIWFFEQQMLEMNLLVSSKLPILNEEALPNICHFKEKDLKMCSFYFNIYIKLQTSCYYLMFSVLPDFSSLNLGSLNESIHLLQIQEFTFTFHDISNSRYNKNKLESIDIGVAKELKDRSILPDKSFPVLLPSFLNIGRVYHLFTDMRICHNAQQYILAPLQKRRMQTYGAHFLMNEHPRLLHTSKLYDILFNIEILISLFHLQHTFEVNGCSELFFVPFQSKVESSRTLILLKPPCPNFVSITLHSSFCKDLLYCRFYLIPKRQWLVQIVHSSPILFSKTSHCTLSYPSQFDGKVLFERFCSDFEAILMLYGSLLELSIYMSSLLKRDFYVQKYDFMGVSISFCTEEQDVAQKAVINIYWSSNDKRFRLEFIHCPQIFAQSSFEELFNFNYSIPQLLIGLSKLLPLYRLIEQSTLNSRIRFQTSPNNPSMIRLGFKLFIDFQFCTNNLVILHPQETTDRLFALLGKFIESMKVSEVVHKEHPDTAPFQISAFSKSYSIPSDSPGFPLKPFSPASKFPSLSQTPHTSKPSPFFPYTSTSISRTHEQFFPSSGFEYLCTSHSNKHLTKTIHFSTFKQLILSKKKPNNSPLANFLAAINLLDYERLVNFGHLPTLDSSCIKLELDSFCILFENIHVQVFLEVNFMDLGIKLSLKDYNNDHNILNDQDIVALESCFHSSKIKSPMFSSNALCCYLKLMSSHANLIQTAAFIFRNYRNPPNDWLWQPELCLTVPDHSLIMPFDDLQINPGVACLFTFPNRTYSMLYLRFLPLKQDHGLILDLILVYDYKQNRIDMKTYGISTSANFDSIGSSINQILAKVNSAVSSNSSSCSLLLAVKEISSHLEL